MARKLRERERCDWCHGRLTTVIFTITLPGPHAMQSVVGTCCARAASEAASRSDNASVVRRAREVIYLLDTLDGGVT